MGNEHFPREEDIKYSRIYGGLSWPGKRPGFIVIVGQLKQPEPGQAKFGLLDEKESFDTHELVAMAGALDFYYKPENWYSDIENKAAMKFIQEFNKVPDRRTGSRRLKLHPSRLLGLKDSVFKYIYPRLKGWVGEGGILDISRGQKILNYMAAPQESEINAIQHGDFPSIESLAFAVFELDEARDTGPRADHAKSEYKHF